MARQRAGALRQRCVPILRFAPNRHTTLRQRPFSIPKNFFAARKLLSSFRTAQSACPLAESKTQKMASELSRLQWIEILQNSEITRELDLSIFQVLYSFEKQAATASQVGLILGKYLHNLRIRF